MKRKVVDIIFEDSSLAPSFLLDDGSVKIPCVSVPNFRVLWLTQKEFDTRKQEETERKEMNTTRKSSFYRGDYMFARARNIIFKAFKTMLNK